LEKGDLWSDVFVGTVRYKLGWVGEDGGFNSRLVVSWFATDIAVVSSQSAWLAVL
jgi:hypothetical protein